MSAVAHREPSSVESLAGTRADVVPAGSWRRDRALATAARLAEAGGWDGVIMRTVAEQSGSALATLYREFPSKANLVIATAEVLLREATPPMRDKSSELGPTRAVADLMDSLTEAALARPRLMEAVLRAALSCDPLAAREVTRLRQQMVDLLMQCLVDPMPEDLARLEIVVDVWFSQMLASVQGCQRVEDARSLVAVAVRCVLGTPQAP